MRRGKVIQQIDGWRYLYECPRGIIAIDEYDDGARDIVQCLGGSDLTRRDIREALRMHDEETDD